LPFSWILSQNFCIFWIIYNCFSSLCWRFIIWSRLSSSSNLKISRFYSSNDYVLYEDLWTNINGIAQVFFVEVSK
jgi:hypothetical protein